MRFLNGPSGFLDSLLDFPLFYPIRHALTALVQLLTTTLTDHSLLRVYRLLIKGCKDPPTRQDHAYQEAHTSEDQNNPDNRLDWSMAIRLIEEA